MSVATVPEFDELSFIRDYIKPLNVKFPTQSHIHTYIQDLQLTFVLYEMMQDT